jgi:hypothetical protein
MAAELTNMDGQAWRWPTLCSWSAQPGGTWTRVSTDSGGACGREAGTGGAQRPLGTQNEAVKTEICCECKLHTSDGRRHRKTQSRSDGFLLILPKMVI